MKNKIIVIVVLTILIISCNKLNIFKRSYFIYYENKYKVENFSGEYFGPSLMRYTFETEESNIIELELSHCSLHGIEEGEYKNNTTEYDFNIIFHKESNGKEFECQKGELSVYEVKPNKYEIELEAELTDGIPFVAYIREDYKVADKENTYLFQNEYFKVDTALVFHYTYNGMGFNEIYLFNDFNNLNAPYIGFLMFDYCMSETRDTPCDGYENFIGFIQLNQSEGLDINLGKLKNTYIEQKDESLFTYDFYFSLMTEDNKKLIGNYVGDIIIQEVKSENPRLKIRKKFAEKNSNFENFIEM